MLQMISALVKTPLKGIIQSSYRVLIKGLITRLYVGSFDHSSYELGCLFGLGGCNYVFFKDKI